MSKPQGDAAEGQKSLMHRGSGLPILGERKFSGSPVSLSPTDGADYRFSIHSNWWS